MIFCGLYSLSNWCSCVTGDNIELKFPKAKPFYSYTVVQLVISLCRVLTLRTCLSLTEFSAPWEDHCSLLLASFLFFVISFSWLSVRISCMEPLSTHCPPFHWFLITICPSREIVKKLKAFRRCQLHDSWSAMVWKSAIINTNHSATRYKGQANLIDTTQRNGTFCFLNGNSACCGFHLTFCLISLVQRYKCFLLHSAQSVASLWSKLGRVKTFLSKKRNIVIETQFTRRTVKWLSKTVHF